MSGYKHGLSTRARSENVVLRRVHLRFHTESEKSCMFQDFFEASRPYRCRFAQDSGLAR